MPPSGRIRRSWRREEAQTMSEYVVVLAIITPAVILALGMFSGAVVTAINTITGFLTP